MTLHKHMSNRGRVAVTPDAQGASLPVLPGEAWHYLSDVSIKRGTPYVGRSGDDVWDDIEKNGYSIIPVEPHA